MDMSKYFPAVVSRGAENEMELGFILHSSTGSKTGKWEGKSYWSKKCRVGYSAVDLAQIYIEETGSTMKCRAYVLFILHTVLQDFRAKLR